MFYFFKFGNVYSMKKSLRYIIIAVVVLFCTTIFAGCSSGAVNFYVTSFPTKLVYKVGENVDLSGLKIESINSDGTNTMVSLKDAQISTIDTSTSGVKKVKVSKGELSTSFNVYVADIVITDSDNFKQKIAQAQDGDVVYLTQGNYIPQNATDTSYKDVVVDKSVVIIGDGASKTKFAGNFLVGAENSSGEFVAKQNFKNVKFLNIGFEIKHTTQNELFSYTGPYGRADKNGALNIFDTQNMLVFNCTFSGYAYGILGQNVKGLTLKKNIFKNLVLNGVKTTKSTANLTMYQNVFMDIATNVVAIADEQQISTGCVELAFATEGNAGVTLANNTFNRTALVTSNVVFYDEYSKQFAKQADKSYLVRGYVDNSAIITLLSSAQDDLLVDGVILCNNNYGQARVNIRLNTTPDNSVDQNGVMITENF